jgi:hypothetical protein
MFIGKGYTKDFSGAQGKNSLTLYWFHVHKKRRRKTTKTTTRPPPKLLISASDNGSQY